MTEENETTQDIEAQGPEPSPGDAWREVADKLNELGDAVRQWLIAAKDDPDNRRQVAELKERLDGVGRQIGDSLEGMAESDFGQSVKDTAAKAGDALKQAGERFSEEVAPRMASAFDIAADKMRQATERSEQKVEPEADTEEAEG